MFKKIFKKPDDGANKSPETVNDRPKIVIKKRTPSNAPIPNGIANAISPNSMPRPQQIVEDSPEEMPSPSADNNTVDQANDQESKAYLDSVSDEIASADTISVEQVHIDLGPYEERISELESANNALQDKTEKLVQENRGLHVEIDTLEKESSSEIASLKESVETQKNNYTALEDQFLMLKDDFDAIKLDYEQIDEDYNNLNTDYEDLLSTSVPKKDLQHIQSKLREESMRKTDLESQVGALKKDTTRYEGMVSELSSHITELKESFEQSAEEQHQKLMEVKDSEISRLQDHHDELKKQLKDLQTEKKKLQSVINDKEALIDENQEFEEKWIDANEKVTELSEDLANIEIEKLEVEDKLALIESDMASYGENVKNFEKSIKDLSAIRNSQTEIIDDQKKKIAVFEKEQKFLEEKLKHIEEKSSSSKDEIQKISASHEIDISEKNKQIASLQQDVKLREEEIQLTKANLSNANVQADESVAKLAEFEAIKQNYEKEKVTLSNDLEKEKAQCAELETEIISLQKQIESLQQNDSLEEITITLSNVQGRYNSLLKTEESLLEEVKALKINLKTSEESNVSSSQLTKDLQTEVDNLGAELKTTLAELALLQQDNSLNDTEKKLSEAQKVIVDLETSLKSSKKEQEKNKKALEQESLKVKKLKTDIEVLANNKEKEESTADKVNQEVISKLQDEISSLQKALDEASKSVEEQQHNAAADPTNYSVNLIMKPDNDEYDLELPGNMNGAEIKSELTDAGLLEEDGSYDLFLPRLDKYIMNNDLLSSCQIKQGEILEIIPG